MSSAFADLSPDKAVELAELLQVMSPENALETFQLLRGALVENVAEADRTIAALQRHIRESKK